MTHKPMIDSNELIKRTEEYMNQYRSNKISYKDHKAWDDMTKAEWKSARSAVYCRMRAENRQRTQHFWLEQIDNGCFKEFFKKFGLRVWNSNVRFYDCGAPVLTQYLNNVVLPALEKEMNIKGVKLKGTRVSGMSSNLLNWEHAEIINEEVSK